MMGEGHNSTGAVPRQSASFGTIRSAAIPEMEMAYGFLGLMLAQWRTGTGDEKARAYACANFHAHTAKLLSIMQEGSAIERLDAMQAEGRA